MANTRKNDIRITRVPGKEARCSATLKLEFDPTDQEAANCFGRILLELIPEGERAQFVSDFQEAATKAGFKQEPLAEIEGQSV